MTRRTARGRSEGSARRGVSSCRNTSIRLCPPRRRANGPVPSRPVRSRRVCIPHHSRHHNRRRLRRTPDSRRRNCRTRTWGTRTPIPRSRDRRRSTSNGRCSIRDPRRIFRMRNGRTRCHRNFGRRRLWDTVRPCRVLRRHMLRSPNVPGDWMRLAVTLAVTLAGMLDVTLAEMLVTSLVWTSSLRYPACCRCPWPRLPAWPPAAAAVYSCPCPCSFQTMRLHRRLPRSLASPLHPPWQPSSSAGRHRYFCQMQPRPMLR
mmetsp:Transcript_15611/g.37500  ORF Transcript_15611/g.37500 Transcript_15611/m.37500 type:complete len:260 (+) Transcript_15611:1089-1868(+)